MGQRITNLKTLAAVVLVATGAAVAVASPAAAGTNGQHVAVCTGDVITAYMGRAWGPNHAGAFADSGWRSLSRADGGRCTWIGDIWFKGQITVGIKHDEGFGGDKYFTCNVPVDQGSNDWVYCWE